VLAAGFGSVRRFDETMKRTYRRPPSALRRGAGSDAGDSAAGVTLRLGFTRPYDWNSILGFLGSRAVPGVEALQGGRYRRTIAVADTTGALEVGLGADGEHVAARIWIADGTALAAVAGKLRRVLDLDAEIGVIEAQLRRDPRLAMAIAAKPGLRVPGAWDPFELAVRAILGQQVSVAGARTLAARIVDRCGEALALPPDAADGGLCRLFPSPARLADTDLTGIGMPGARARAVTALARAVAADPGLLRPRATLEQSVEALCALPGVGPWTAQYIAMRALGEPDAFPASDLGILRALADGNGVRPSPAEALARAQAWRPWRAYAVLHLWLGEVPAPGAKRSAT
jgi:AraC family transcriptional regulator of adaptative response / DNA-3-methyladenine glycosylase II